MEVIRRGGPWSLDFCCTADASDYGGCSSLLRVMQDDLYLRYGSDGTRAFFLCCVCGRENSILKDMVPWRVLQGRSCLSQNDVEKRQQAFWARVQEERDNPHRAVYEKL